jgi:tRNA(fMet)-specific endonuclease VapC
MRYLLDTTILLEPLKSLPNSQVMERLKEYQKDIVTTTTVWHELWFRCFRVSESETRQQIEIYLQEVLLPYLPILPYNQAAAEWHAEERARLYLLGQTPPFGDGQIAAIAKVNDLILVTAHAAKYQMFNGLLLENWLVPDESVEAF